MSASLPPYLSATGLLTCVVGRFHTSVSRARRQLFDANPHCTWCGNLTQWPTGLAATTGILLADTATLDHLLTVRQRQPFDPAPAVLACFACNQFRSRLDAARARYWPLSLAQVTQLLVLRKAYLERLAASDSLGLPVAGRSDIAAEYVTATQNLFTTSAILTSPAAQPLSSDELFAIQQRIAFQQSLPAFL